MTSAHHKYHRHIRRLIALSFLFALTGLSIAAIYRQINVPSGLIRSTLTEFSKLPTYDFDNKNRPSDPINLVLIGSKEQLTSAFDSAHWVKSDPTNPLSVLKVLIYSPLSLDYPTAPMSNQYLFGRVQDLALQKPGPNIKTRDHVRIWDSGYDFEDGRRVWVGAATYDDGLVLDIKNYFIPTHSISPDVDKERDVVVKDLLASPGYGSTITYQSQTPKKNLQLGSNVINTDGLVKVVLFK